MIRDPSLVADAQRSVFIPAVLSVGLLISAMTLIRDAVHRLRGQQWLARQAETNGRKTALLTEQGPPAAAADGFGRRRRVVFAVIGVASIGLATYVAVGSYGNYIGWTGWVHTIGWIWFAYLLCIAAFAALGAVCLVIAVRWTAAPAWTQPLLAHSPLSVVEPTAPPRARLRLREQPAQAGQAARPLGAEQIDARSAALLRTAAAVWTTIVVLLLSLLAFQDRLPQPPDTGIFETAIAGPIQIALLVLVTVGSLICGRNEPVGAAVMAAAGSALAIVAAVQYPTSVAVLVALAFAVPAFLHWLAWQRDRHVHHLVALATVTALLITGVAVGADALSDAVLGPSHPESATVLPVGSSVEWIWVGGTTTRSTTIIGKVLDPARPAVLTVSEEVAPGPDAVATVDGEWVTDEIVQYEVDGLEPDKRYSYRVGDAGPITTADGSFRTFPEGAASFQVAFGSCSRTGSSGSVFDDIRDLDPLLFIQLGDLNYANVRGDDLPRFLRAYDRTLSAPAQSALYRSTSTAYVWDDHDYGGNDADRLSPSRPAAQAAYRLATPHHPFAAPADDGAVYQSFAVGRVQFVMTDLRSHRDPADQTGPDKSMLGATQLAWFEAELARAATDGKVVVWVSSSPWIDEATPTGDSWGGYADERRHIAEVVRDLGLGDRMVMLAGDGHMVALDDGTNAAYAGPGSGFPVAHGGALDRPGGAKGGPFSDGQFPGSGQYGTLDIVDTGGTDVQITITGNTWDGRTLVDHTFTLRAAP